MRKTSQSRQSEKTPDGNAARRLASVFADVLRLPPHRLQPDLGPGDVEGWDSVGHVMLVCAIEEEFSVRLEVDEIMEFTNVRAILSTIERRLAALPHDVGERERTET